MSGPKHPAEAEMRGADVPFIDGLAELTEYIDGLVHRPHDYGTCVYAMSMAGVAAMKHVASALGMTGFQASCADMDVIRRMRGIEGPFALFKASDLCYPQYDLPARFAEWMRDSAGWVADECARLRESSHDKRVSDTVRAHWDEMIRQKPADEEAAS